MAYSYKTSIGFGLVYIPVTLHNTIKNNDIGFNMLDKKTKSRIQYKKTWSKNLISLKAKKIKIF